MGTTIHHTAPPLVTITGWRFRVLELKMLLRLSKIAFGMYPGRADAWRALRRHIPVHLAFRRACHLTKAICTDDGRVFTQMSFPHIDSAAMYTMASSELLRDLPVAGRQSGLNRLILAITKKCSLRCAHCFEWDALNGRESLSAGDILEIIRKFQANGLATIELSGGEPLNRYDDLLRILRESDTKQTDFWIASSGYRLTAQRASALHKEGLTGVAISLDHWDAAAHDRFRGMDGSFEWARQAVKNARAAGLAVGLSLTAVRDFCTPEHLWRYALLAREWGVHIIRILEPQPVGHYAGQDVLLGPPEVAVLEAFVEKIQRKRAFRDFPIVEYYAPHQRQAGCSGAGKRFLYVDTDGDMHACPFCQHKCGNAVKDSLDTGIANMALAGGCHRYSGI